jgi:hypothetical protein
MFQQGVTLKELLENPDLLNPPKPTERVPNPESKLKDGVSSSQMYAGQSAFLGPNIWDKTVPYAEDFNLEYMDLDEFLLENCGNEDKQSTGAPSPVAPLPPAQMSPPPMVLSPMHHSPLQQLSPVLPPTPHRQQSSPDSPLVASIAPNSPQQPTITTPPPKTSQLEKYLIGAGSPAQLLSPSPPQTPASTTGAAAPPPPPTTNTQPPHSMESGESTNYHGYDAADSNDSCSDDDDSSLRFPPGDLALAKVPGQEDFDPCKRVFTEEELRPQPMIKKSRKIYVPDDLKDDKYWCRRKKNNTAAKRSRDARRVKENQIAMRASFLEKAADDLRDQLEIEKEKNQKLRLRLEKYEGKS